MASFSVTDVDVADPLTTPFNGVRVVHDPIKGRCLENLISRQAGDLLFVEEALVFSSFVEHEENAPDGIDAHVNGQLLQRAFGLDVVNELHDIHEELSALPKIDCLDTARNCLQLIAVTHLGETLKAEEGGHWVRPLALLSQLTPGVHLSELQDTIRTFRHAYPRILPADMSDYQAAMCLGILNTNQVELEDFGGSGLFVGTAIMEHSCAFNCSYTTRGSTLYMTATRNIAPGDRLSIDYDNNFYSPTLVRKISLYESYGFLCTCPLCDGDRIDRQGVHADADAIATGTEGAHWGSEVDRKRAFWCTTCKQQGNQGIVCPMGPTSQGLRTVLSQTSGADAGKASPVRPGGKGKKGKQGKSKGKSKSKKNPAVKVASAMDLADNEEEDDADYADAEDGAPLDLRGLDLEALANALESVPLAWSVCSTCGTLPTPAYTKKCLAREEHYRQNSPESHEEVISAGNEREGMLHESHYLLFQSLSDISHDLTNEARRRMDFGISPMDGTAKGGKGKGKQAGKAAAAPILCPEQRQQMMFEPALRAMQHCVRLLDQVLPLVHHEKVMFYDRLGQLAVCAGQTDLARGAFSSAYKMSVLASGEAVPQTQQLLALAESPPLTRDELAKRYSTAQDMDTD